MIRDGRSLGQEFLGLSLAADENHQPKGQRSSLQGRSKKGHHNHVVFGVCYAILPYLMQRAGRRGWDDVYKTLMIVKRRVCTSHILRWVLGFEGVIESADGGGQRRNDLLRGDERLAAHYEMRQRMMQRVVEQEEVTEDQPSVEPVGGNAECPQEENTTTNDQRLENRDQLRPTQLWSRARGVRTFANCREFLLFMAMMRRIKLQLWGILRRMSSASDHLGPQAHSLAHDANENTHSDLDMVSALFKWLVRMNLALFCISGKYPTILHRVIGIRLQQGGSEDHRPPLSLITQRPAYQAVGLMLLIQSMAKLTHAVAHVALDALDKKQSRRRTVESHNTDRNISLQENAMLNIEAYMDSLEARVPSVLSLEQRESQHLKQDGKQVPTECSICMKERKHPAAPIGCGHVFCWECIQEWISTVRKECPLCRVPTMAQDVIALHKYSR
jgi:peroxin-10